MGGDWGLGCIVAPVIPCDPSARLFPGERMLNQVDANSDTIPLVCSAFVSDGDVFSREESNT